MAKRTAYIRARTEPEIKKRAEAVLRKLGVKPSTAVDMFYRQIALRGELPMEIRLPNATTRAALSDAVREHDLVEFESEEDFFADLED